MTRSFGDRAQERAAWATPVFIPSPVSVPWHGDAWKTRWM